jgi:PAS domain-containing protein
MCPGPRAAPVDPGAVERAGDAGGRGNGSDAVQRFLPLEVRPGETYQKARYRARLPEDCESCDRLGTESIRVGKSYQQEFRCRAQDGTIHWLHEDVHVETVVEGKQWRAVGVCTDITEAKRAEQALQESESLYRMLGEAVPDFVWACGADGQAIFANKRMMDYTGQILGQPDSIPRRPYTTCLCGEQKSMPA